MKLNFIYWPPPLSHNTLSFPPKFCINYCFQFLSGTRTFPREIESNSLRKMLGKTKCITGMWKWSIRLGTKPHFKGSARQVFTLQCGKSVQDLKNLVQRFQVVTHFHPGHPWLTPIVYAVSLLCYSVLEQIWTIIYRAKRDLWFLYV